MRPARSAVPCQPLEEVAWASCPCVARPERTPPYGSRPCSNERLQGQDAPATHGQDARATTRALLQRSPGFLAVPNRPGVWRPRKGLHRPGCGATIPGGSSPGRPGRSSAGWAGLESASHRRRHVGDGSMDAAETSSAKQASAGGKGLATETWPRSTGRTRFSRRPSRTGHGVRPSAPAGTADASR